MILRRRMPRENAIYPVVEQLAKVTRFARRDRQILIRSFPRKMEKMGPVTLHRVHFLLTCDNFADTIERVSPFLDIFSQLTLVTPRALLDGRWL